MTAEQKYCAARFNLASPVLADLARLTPWRSYVALAGIWLTLTLLIVGYWYLTPPQFQPWLYLPLGFLVAGRQGALLQLVHEGAHRLFGETKVADGCVRWLCAYPLGVSPEGYTAGHRGHHAYTGTKNDPPSDTEKYRVTDVRSAELYRLFAKDLFGLTALQVFFSYQEKSGGSGARKLMGICLMQAVVLLALFQGNPLHYILLWAVPAASFHMVLMRVRGMAEHGLPRQLGVGIDNVAQGTLHTRSFITPGNRYGLTPLCWLEKALIGSLSVHYHHEHHLFPNVPFYNLQRLHRLVHTRVAENNPHVYAKGYLAAAAFNLFAEAQPRLSTREASV